MKFEEFPESLDEAMNLMDKLKNQAEDESDKDRRRELHLLRIELRDHIIALGRMQTVGNGVKKK